ncbi:MAG: hypothetical protein DDT18_01828 [Actinobacteria bacterium]|nr:hypothetical protein [Actinomycetota bacterium]
MPPAPVTVRPVARPVVRQVVRPRPAVRRVAEDIVVRPERPTRPITAIRPAAATRVIRPEPIPMVRDAIMRAIPAAAVVRPKEFAPDVTPYRARELVTTPTPVERDRELLPAEGERRLPWNWILIGSGGLLLIALLSKKGK